MSQNILAERKPEVPFSFTAPLVPAAGDDPLCTLRFVVLGLLARRHMRAFELRRAVHGSPYRHFSPQPGSVYRALKQLAKWRWVVEIRYERIHARPAGLYFITETGLQALRTWALEMPAKAEVVHDPAAALARFFFLDTIAEPGEAVGWLTEFERHLDEYLCMVRTFQRWTNDVPAVREAKRERKWISHAPDWEVASRHGNLALEAPHALHSGLKAWAHRARAELADDLQRVRSAKAEEEHYERMRAFVQRPIFH